MKTLTTLLLAVLLAACSTIVPEDRMTLDERQCAQYMRQLTRLLDTDRQDFVAIASTWTMGDPPIDARQWLDGKTQLRWRIENNCLSPETSVFVNIGGRNKIVDITLRPVPYERPARKGVVTIEDVRSD